MPQRDVIQEWVEALESGEYKQTRGALHDVSGLGEHSFCCLGVLCELAVEAGVQRPSTSRHNHASWGYPVDGGSEGAILPEVVADWAHVSLSPFVTVYGIEEPLTALNDGGHNFHEIAALIRSTYLSDSDA